MGGQGQKAFAVLCVARVSSLASLAPASALYLRHPRNRQASPFDACEAAPVSTQAMVRPSPFLFLFPGAEMANWLCTGSVVKLFCFRVVYAACQLVCVWHAGRICAWVYNCVSDRPTMLHPACVYQRSESVVHKRTSKQANGSYLLYYLVSTYI
jgi:hypothetical protein